MAIVFDGSSQYGSATTPAAIGTGPCTLMFWLNIVSVYSGTRALFGAGQDDGGYIAAYLDNSSLKLRVSCATDFFTFDTALSTGTWYKVMMTKNSSGIVTCYIDGSAEATTHDLSNPAYNSWSTGAFFGGTELGEALSNVRIAECCILRYEATSDQRTAFFAGKSPMSFVSADRYGPWEFRDNTDLAPFGYGGTASMTGSPSSYTHPSITYPDAYDNFARSDRELDGDTLQDGTNTYDAPGGTGNHAIASEQYDAIGSTHGIDAALIVDSAPTGQTTLTARITVVNGNKGCLLVNGSGNGFAVWRGAGGETDLYSVVSYGLDTNLDTVAGGSADDDIEIYYDAATTTVIGRINGADVISDTGITPVSDMKPGIYGYSGEADGFLATWEAPAPSGNSWNAYAQQ